MFLLTNLTLIVLAVAICVAALLNLKAMFLRVLLVAIYLQPFVLSVLIDFPPSYTLFGSNFVYSNVFLFPFYFFLSYFFYIAWLYGVNDRESVIFLVLILFAALSLNILIASRNLYVVFFSAELFTLISFMLLLSGTSDYAYLYGKSVVKYFLLSCLLTSVLFFLASHIYVTFKTCNLESILYYTYNTKNWSLNIFFAVILFKLGTFPFYFIYVDLYEYLTWRVFFFFNYVVKLFFLSFLITFYNYCFTSINFSVAFTIAILSMLIGCIGVFNTSRLRRLLIYSSLFNLGSALLLLLLDSGPVAYGYILVYSFLSSFLIISFMHFEKVKNYVFNRISDIALIHHGSHVIYFCIIFFALSGIPPFSFFWFKLNLFMVSFQFLNFYIIFFLILSSALITVAYFRIIKYLLYDCKYAQLNFNDSLPFFIYLVLVLTNFGFTHTELLFLLAQLS